MSEAEIFEIMFKANEAAPAVVSMVFALVSGHLVALYLFSASGAAGAAPVGFQTAVDGACRPRQHGRRDPIASERPVCAMSPSRRTGSSFPLAPGTVSQQEIGVAVGWAVAVAVYAALAYFAFFYRWPAPGEPSSRTALSALQQSS